MSAIDLTLFCAHPPDHPWKRCPGLVGQHVVAFNGDVLVAVPHTKEYGEVAAVDALSEKTSHLFVEMNRVLLDPGAAWRTAVSVDVPSGWTCPACTGAGLCRTESCEECAGKQRFVLDGYLHECFGCGGRGKVAVPAFEGEGERCTRCSGFGTVVSVHGMDCLGTSEFALAPHILRMIQTLPACEFTWDAIVCAVFIRFEGGFGCARALPRPT